MWETAFDISMLTNPKVIVSCPDKDLVAEFMDLLAENGIRWCGSNEEIPNELNSRWREYRENTCYWIDDEGLAYADLEYAESSGEEEYAGYIKCTFYGIDTPEFEAATDDELLSLLGI